MSSPPPRSSQPSGRGLPAPARRVGGAPPRRRAARRSGGDGRRGDRPRASRAGGGAGRREGPRRQLVPARPRPGRSGAAWSRPTALTPSADGFAVPLIGGDRPLGLLEIGPARPGEEPRWATPGFAEAVAAGRRGRRARAPAADGPRGGEPAAQRRAQDRAAARRVARVPHAAHGHPHLGPRALGGGRRGAGRGRAARRARRGDRRLDRLVANLLDLSRLEAGALVARMDWCAPAKIVAGAIDAAAPLLGGTEVATDVPSTLPLVRADPVLCERILVNLLHNAVRHGAPPVTVEGRVAGERLELVVGGAGPAWPLGRRPRLRTLRRRGGERRHRCRTGPGAGSGRGAGRRADRGAARRGRGTVRALVRARPRAPGRLMARPRILVVDDEPQVLRSLSAALAAAGDETAGAGSVAEAVEAAALRPPDAVVLDLLLPDGSGVEVARRLREWTQVPIVVVSAVDEETEKIAALDAGADDYVTKPYAVGELLARLRAALRRGAARPGGHDGRLRRRDGLPGPARGTPRRCRSPPHPARVRAPRRAGPAPRARADAPGAAGRRVGPATPARPITCGSPWATCGASSRPTHRARSTWSPRPAWATGCASRRLEALYAGAGVF